MTRKISYNILSYLGCLLIAFLFCLKFSYTTSFLYNGCHGVDSAIFYIIGKFWAQGYIPYVDLWDHKGPIIFFVNCLGHLLTGDKTGVFILQVVSLSVFVFFTFLTFRRSLSSLVSCLLTIVSLFWLSCSYEAGNLTEEYLLPYLAMAVYFTANWLDKTEAQKEPIDHNPWQAFLLGFILGFSFLTRLTNALAACGIMLTVGCVLLYQKKWKNLWKNVLFFCLGFCAIVLPFCAYFAAKGALSNMLFGSVFYNYDVLLFTSKKSFSQTAHYNYRDLFLFAIMCANSLCLIVISVINFFLRKDHRLSCIIWFSSSLLLSIWLLSSNLSAHYRTLAVPFFPILVLEILELKKSLPAVAILILVLLICGPIGFTLRKWNSAIEYYMDPKVPVICDYVQKYVPDESRDAFVGYSISQGAYIELNIKPCYHNFSLQETQSAKSSILKEDIISEFSSLKAKYILTPSNDILISEILNNHYYQLPSPKELPDYHLWVRNDLIE